MSATARSVAGLTGTVGRLALLWRGDREARRQATPENNRWHKIFAELAAQNIHAEPCVYCEEVADEVCEQLRQVDGAHVASREAEDLTIAPLHGQVEAEHLGLGRVVEQKLAGIETELAGERVLDAACE